MPEGNYQQFVEKNRPTDQRRFFSTKFNDIQKEYNKALAGFAADNPAVSPTTNPKLDTFSNFLKNFDFDAKYFDASKSERGGPGWNEQDYAPRTKYRF